MKLSVVHCNDMFLVGILILYPSIHPSIMCPHLQYVVCLQCIRRRKNGPSRSHCPVPCTGVCFVKDFPMHCRHYCPRALSHMKPNRYGAVLDWKLEAVSTRIYWFLSFFSPCSLLLFRPSPSVQTGIKSFILQQGLRCTVPDWALLLCSERKTRPVGDLCFHWPCLISVQFNFRIMCAVMWTIQGFREIYECILGKYRWIEVAGGFGGKARLKENLSTLLKKD